MYDFISTIVTTPLTPIFACFIAGVFVKRLRWKKILFSLSLLLVLLFTDYPLLKFASEQWYKDYDHPLPAGKTYDYGIVLGGYATWDWERERAEYGQSADRLIESIRLYHMGKVKKLILASDASIMQTKDGKGWQGNPDGMRRYLTELGVPSEDVIMETYAENTRENVLFTKELLGDELTTADVLLITSAVHMKRSIKAFHREGLHPDTYITDTCVDPHGESVSYWPSHQAMVEWSGLLHEWVGYLFYMIRG